MENLLNKIRSGFKCERENLDNDYESISKFKISEVKSFTAKFERLLGKSTKGVLLTVA